ncbi:MAG: hypothetical protein JNL01_10400 [Bdellovibrionales bacterium]|nr:hypothetical protein [Bdellovibrionales bacterium]
MKLTRISILFTSCLCLLLGCASTSHSGRITAQGEIGRDKISSEVDSEIARYFIEEYLPAKKSNPQLDAKISSILGELEKTPLSNERLKEIADQTSLDFGAMLFAHLQTKRNLKIKNAFITQYDLVKQGKLHLKEATQRYRIVLVPGLFYRSKPETKGDLREVKQVLEEAGFEVVSVPILEAGSVEENAAIIADFIKNESVQDKKLILVSTSKGGPDTLYALGALLDQESAKKVSLWFSVGGALRGSYLADLWSKWPRSWLASVIGVFQGFSISMVRSLSVEESKKRLEKIKIPNHIRVVHFVGVPLSGTVSDEVKGGYKELQSCGPNDGITLLSDEILDGSSVITALGLDHWYRDPDLKRKILALVATVTVSH